MKSFKILIGVLALSIGLAAPIAGAQDTDAQKQNRTQALAEYLGLNGDQQKQVSEIYKNETARIKALGDNPDKAGHQAIMEETKQKIAALLTPAQQQKYNEFLSIKDITPKQKTKEKEQGKPAGCAAK